MMPDEEDMKIYFAGSIRAGRDDAAIYEAMITWLRSFGEVLTEHVGNPALSETGDDGPDDRYIHDRDMAWLSSCDLVVAEVTAPSLGVGYELGWATALKKPVLCLHRTTSGATLVRHDRRQPRRYKQPPIPLWMKPKQSWKNFIRKTAEGITGSYGSA